MKRNLVVLAVVFTLVAIVAYQNFIRADSEPLPVEQAPQSGYLAPFFAMADREGVLREVNGEREKALLINFWATWCAPCRIEMPDLVELYDKYGEQLDIYAVNATATELSVADVERFVADFGLNFPVIMDPDNELVGKYRVHGYPTSFLIDKNGVVREVLLGIRAKEELEKLIQLVL